MDPFQNPSHLPCSQSDIRLAAAVTDDAGGLLHHLFTHHRRLPEQVRSLLAGIFSVAVVVRDYPAWTYCFIQ
jgi:hypothetical protein